MRYPRELIEEIRMQNDIVDVISQYVPLKQKGSSYFGLCPFHHEKTPSFSVNSEKQFYYCFGCGASGNVYGFLMEMENCDFPEAVKKLAERANIPLPEPQMTGQALAMERLKARLFEMRQEGFIMTPSSRKKAHRHGLIWSGGNSSQTLPESSVSVIPQTADMPFSTT